jgi:DNA (cytosine-5)-methyltransferase 1
VKVPCRDTARHDPGFRRAEVPLDAPCIAILASGAEQTRFEVHETEERVQVPKSEKPPYRVPTMEEIRVLPWNGMTVVSTFSGAGGSSCGYKMAGFKVLWASEFVQAARDTYAANFPDTILDARDIREVKPEEILQAIGLKAGELDLLDGSPPCAAFSTAGKREKKWGKVSTYSDTSQQSDDLFFEYARILKGLQPKTFVAENVYGLVKGVAKGYFKEIHKALEECGYKVKARLLDAQWLGVPQQRQRVIFIGVRNDLGVDPVHPTPRVYRYSLRDALSHVVRQMSNAPYGQSGWQDSSCHPSQTIGAGPSSGNGRSPPSVVEVSLRSDRTKRGERSADIPVPTVMTHNRPSTHGEISIVEEKATVSGYAIGKEWDKLRSGEQSEKYFSLVRPRVDRPSPTITQRGGDAGAACVTHPTEKRKFTIAELKRVCSFPDDFVLTGTYAQQWERCGRAVPPLMMRAIAETLRDQVLARAR